VESVIPAVKRRQRCARWLMGSCRYVGSDCLCLAAQIADETAAKEAVPYPPAAPR